jgi:hypothetical protein
VVFPDPFGPSRPRTEDRAVSDLEAHPVEGHDIAIALAQPGHCDRGTGQAGHLLIIFTQTNGLIKSTEQDTVNRDEPAPVSAR